MVIRTTGPPVVPSRNALRVLRKLALAGSTVGSFCTVAAITYDVHRRIRVAESIIENKRALQTSAPNYDATSAAKRMARMMEAAEAGEFMGLESLKEQDRKLQQAQHPQEEQQIGPKEWEERTHYYEGGDFPGGLARPKSFFEAAQSRMSRKFGLNRQQSEALPFSSTRSPPANTPLPVQMRDLLKHNRPIEAAQLFLDAHPASMEGISSDRRQAVIQAFDANCKQGNVFIARNIFERLEDIDRITMQMWQTLIFALAKNGCIESAATLYTRYRKEFHVPSHMVDIVLRCLLESHRLSIARSFLFGHLDVDRNCGLCGAYLTGLWKKTRSIDLLNTQLEKLLKALPLHGKYPTEKLFNPVLKAYIQFGRLGDAEALVADMTTKYAIPLYTRSRGLLLYGKALSGDWDAVELGLDEMRILGMNMRRKEFIPIFDSIFLEYWVSHNGAEIRDFVFRCIDEYEIVPDQLLYKHFLDAFVEKGDMSMIAELASMAQERSWNIKMPESEFMEILRSRRHALEISPVGLWQMLQAARIHHGRTATSQRVLGYDQRSFPFPDANKMPLSQRPLSWTLKEKRPVSAKFVDRFLKLHRQMAHRMHVGKITQVLDCYSSAKTAGFQVKILHVELATIATLLEYGLDAARAFIRDEWPQIRDPGRFYPIFFRQIEEINSGAEEEEEAIKMAIFRFYELCTTNKQMTAKHHLTVATSRRLIVNEMPDTAVGLLSSVYMSQYRRMSDFDGVCMKMFVRAFAETENIEGIRWCILTGLSRPDGFGHDFDVEVRRIMAALRQKHEASYYTGDYDAVSRTRQLNYLKYIHDLLWKKGRGDEVLTEELQLDPMKKRLSRKKLRYPLLDEKMYEESAVLETIEDWDEEQELEFVLGIYADETPVEVTDQWNEAECLGDSWPVEEAPV